jgi:predicted nucleic acid-binding protein
MLVVDTPAVVHALMHRPADPRLLDRLAADELGAPHVIDLEVLHVLRRHVRLGTITARSTRSPAEPAQPTAAITSSETSKLA